MEDVHEREFRYGQRGAIVFNAPLVQKTYYLLGFDHEEVAVYYLFRSQLYRCTAYLGSMRHDFVDEEEVLAVSSCSMRWTRLDSFLGYTQEEAYRIIQRHLANDIAEYPYPLEEKGWFKTLLEAIFG